MEMSLMEVRGLKTAGEAWVYSHPLLHLFSPPKTPRHHTSSTLILSLVLFVPSTISPCVQCFMTHLHPHDPQILAERQLKKGMERGWRGGAEFA